MWYCNNTECTYKAATNPTGCICPDCCSTVSPETIRCPINGPRKHPKANAELLPATLSKSDLIHFQKVKFMGRTERGFYESFKNFFSFRISAHIRSQRSCVQLIVNISHPDFSFFQSRKEFKSLETAKRAAFREVEYYFKGLEVYGV